MGPCQAWRLWMGPEEAGVIQSIANALLRSARTSLSWGGRISRACLGHRGHEMLCWEGSSQTFCGTSFLLSQSSVGFAPDPHPSCIPNGRSHTFLLRIPLVQTLFYPPCSGQWKQTCSAAQTETVSGLPGGEVELANSTTLTQLLPALLRGGGLRTLCP